MAGVPTGSNIERFKVKTKFIDIRKELEISKNTILFKRSIVKFLSKYPRIKKSSLSFHFLKNH